MSYDYASKCKFGTLPLYAFCYVRISGTFHEFPAVKIGKATVINLETGAIVDDVHHNQNAYPFEPQRYDFVRKSAKPIVAVEAEKHIEEVLRLHKKLIEATETLRGMAEVAKFEIQQIKFLFETPDEMNARLRLHMGAGKM